MKEISQTVSRSILGVNKIQWKKEDVQKEMSNGI